MIPTSLAAVVAFLLLVAPGALFNICRQRHEPTVRETALVEVSRVVLASLAATAVAFGLLAWVWWSIYDAVEHSLGVGFQVRAMAAAVATSGLACGLVLIVVAVRWPASTSPTPIQPGRAWYQVMVKQRPKDASTYLSVELVDGSAWRGTYMSQDVDPEDGDRNLVIGPPGLARRKASDPTTAAEQSPAFALVKTGQAVLLPEAQIRSIRATFPRSSPAPEEPQPK